MLHKHTECLIVCSQTLGFNMFIEIQQMYTILQWLYKYMKKRDNNNSLYIHNGAIHPIITKDKEGAVQLRYLSIGIKSRQQYSRPTSVLL